METAFGETEEGSIVRNQVDGYTGDTVNLSSINDNVTPANNIWLGYNASNGLQYASGAWGVSNYYYDIGGNRTYDINTVSSVATTKVTYFDSATNHMTSTWNGATQLRNWPERGPLLRSSRSFEMRQKPTGLLHRAHFSPYDGAGNITRICGEEF